MHLFLAMVLNFILAVVFIHTCVKWQVLFARYHRPHLLERYNIEAFETDPPAFLAEGGLGLGLTGKEKWDAMRRYFIETVNQTAKDDVEVLREDIFDFSRYIAVSMDQVIMDVVDFSAPTWFLVLCIFLIHTLTAGLVEYQDVGHTPGIEVQVLVVSAISPLVAYVIVMKSRWNLIEIVQKATAQDWTYEDDDFAREHSVETYVARVLQGFMFVTSYGVSRLLASKTYWKSVKAEPSDIWLLATYIFLYLWVGLILLPEALINATVCFALPPYVDELNQRTIISVRDYSRAHRDQDTKIVNRIRRISQAAELGVVRDLAEHDIGPATHRSGFQEPASFDTLVQTESDGVEMHDLEPAMADSPLPGAAQLYGLQKGM